MKIIIPLLALFMMMTTQAEAARGRQPCSGSKGGISHCTADGGFICNDGGLSQSKRFCSGYGTGSSQRQLSSSSSNKKQTKITQSNKNTASQITSSRPVENEASLKPQPRMPTCAPIYMADKAGFTHLPICSGNQY